MYLDIFNKNQIKLNGVFLQRLEIIPCISLWHWKVIPLLQCALAFSSVYPGFFHATKPHLTGHTSLQPTIGYQLAAGFGLWSKKGYSELHPLTFKGYVPLGALPWHFLARVNRSVSRNQKENTISNSFNHKLSKC